MNSESIFFHNVDCHISIQLFTTCTKSHNCLLSRIDFLVDTNILESGCGISNNIACESNRLCKSSNSIKERFSLSISM